MATPISYPSRTADNNGCCLQPCFTGATGGRLFRKPLHDHDDDTRKAMKTTEDLLASELSKLSVQERSKALDDLHCVGEDLQETPELIVNSLSEFDRILKERNDPIYNIATTQNPAYVEDSSFRLRFLRANNHDAQKSVNQMIALLTRKDKYFGRDKLAREITMDDLNDEDMDLLRSGVYHIQDETDRNGRIVVYFLNHAITTTLKAETLIRVNYFVMFSILSRLESVQRKGIVLCYYDMSTPGNPCHPPQLEKDLRCLDFATRVPIRRSAAHLCLKALPDSLISKNVLLKTLIEGFQRYARARARIHYGSDIELQYKLRDHGLNLETIPVDINGNLRKYILNVWLDKLAANEGDRLAADQWDSLAHHERGDSKLMSSETPMRNNADQLDSFDRYDESEGSLLSSEAPPSNSNNNSQWPTVCPVGFVVVEPTPKDVLLGRGKASQNHPGNVRFREILAMYQEEYNNTQRYKRYDTPKEITRLLLEDGVRFLQKTENGNGWVECDAAEAEKKVKQVFRTQKKTMANRSMG